MKRKVHQGKKYDKEKTKKKIIQTVGKVLMKDGYHNLKINRIASASGHSKGLIYEYFGNLDGLLKAYLRQVDFWKIEEKRIEPDVETDDKVITKDFMLDLLKSDFQYFFDSPEMQKIVLWGISEKNSNIRKLTEEREALGETIFRKTDVLFNNTKVDYRATIAVFISAIYYIVLHAKVNGSTMCGIDMSTNDGRNRILNALELLLNQTYENLPDTKKRKKKS